MSAIVRWMDSMASFLAGIGGATDKLASAYYVVNELSPEQLLSAYRGNWISRKLVDIPPEDMTREWRRWQAENDQIELLEKAEKQFKLKAKVREAVTKARLYGGAGIVIGVEGDQMKPLDVKRIRKDGLRFVHVLSRWELSNGPLISDPFSEWYGEPEWYQRNTLLSVDNVYERERIHPSRVIKFVGAINPNRIAIGEAWGDSVLQVADDAIRAAGLVVPSVAQLVAEAKTDIIRTPDLATAFATPASTANITKRYSTSAAMKSSSNTLLLDSSEEWQRATVNFAGLPDVLQMYLLITCASADIPATRFLGRSPQGLNATGESDIRNYYDMLRAGQSELPIEILDEVLIYSALGSRDENIYYEWSPLWQMTEAEKADIAKKKAEVVQIDNTIGLMPLDALAKCRQNQLVEDGFYPGIESALEDAEMAGEITIAEERLQAEQQAQTGQQPIALQSPWGGKDAIPFVVRDLNPYHVESGEKGGQFTSGSGQSSEQPGQSSKQALFEKLKRDGGFTYNVIDESAPAPGDKAYVLSPYKDRERVLDADELTPENYAEYIVDNWDMLSQPGHYFGGWHNPDDNKVYFDTSIVVTDPDEAVELCQEHKQLAYFDMEKMETVSVEPQGDDDESSDDAVLGKRRYRDDCAQDSHGLRTSIWTQADRKRIGECAGHFEKAAATITDLNPYHVESGEKGGQFTSGPGQSSPEKDKPEKEKQSDLDKAVVDVGGDAWNQETALRLETEYKTTLPKIEAAVESLVGGEVEGEEEDFEAGVPDSWDMMSESQQEDTFSKWKDNNFDAFMNDELNSWWEGDEPSLNALTEIEDSFNNKMDGDGYDPKDKHEWFDSAIDELRDTLEGPLDNPLVIPYTNEQLFNAITLNRTDDYNYKPEDVEFDDSKLPGFEPPDYSGALTEEMRAAITEAVLKAEKNEMDNLIQKMEPPDYLSELTKETMDIVWSDSTDEDTKFKYAKQYGVIEEPEEKEPTNIVIPSRFDPLQDTKDSNEYRATQRLACALANERAYEIMRERGIKDQPSKIAIQGATHDLWEQWKESSTSRYGLIIQTAAADELGGRLYESRLKECGYDRESLREVADSDFSSIGGYAGVRAIIRASWETSQYLLDKADLDELVLYRGLTLKEGKGGAIEDVKGYKRLADAFVNRNGAASTSTHIGVANNWAAGSANKVTMRVHVPRTAVISIPAFGINVHSEREVVIAGTAWKGWDVWDGSAPHQSDIPVVKEKKSA